MSLQDSITPGVASKMTNTGKNTILKLIGSGALKATNMGTATLPRWRIELCDLEEFLRGRCNQPKIMLDRSPKQASSVGDIIGVGGTPQC